MTTLKNFTRDENVSQENMFQFITKFSSELKDDAQFKKAQSCVESEFMDAIKANSNLYRKYTNNILPICGIFEALININDFEGAILFYNKYAESIDKRYLFFFEHYIEKLKSLMSRKDQNPYLKYYGKYEGSVIMDNKTKPSFLQISVISKQFFEVILVINEKYYVTCTLSLNGEINSYKDENDFSNDPDDFDDRDTINGNGTIDNLFNIEFNFELVSHYQPLTKFKFFGTKKIDYFNSEQNDFTLK